METNKKHNRRVVANIRPHSKLKRVGMVAGILAVMVLTVGPAYSSSALSRCELDTNSDGVINILDLVAIITAIINGNTASLCAGYLPPATPIDEETGPLENIFSGSINYTLATRAFSPDEDFDAVYSDISLISNGSGDVGVEVDGELVNESYLSPRGRFASETDLPMMLHLMSVLPSDPSAISQLGSTWTRNIPEDISEHEDSLVLRALYSSEIISLNPTRMRIEGRAKLGENSGTAEGLRNLFPENPGDFTKALIHKLSNEGALFASGEAVFSNGHWESIQVTTSLEAMLSGTHPTADPYRTVYALNRNQ